MDERIFDEYDREVNWYDDDYEYYKRESERAANPLDDDYNKYDNE